MTARKYMLNLLGICMALIHALLLRYYISGAEGIDLLALCLTTFFLGVGWAHFLETMFAISKRL